MKTCSVDYCHAAVQCSDLCSDHYRSDRRYGHSLYMDASIQFVLYEEDTKQCSTCHEILPFDSFGTYKRKGETKVNAGCKACNYARQEAWRKEGTGKQESKPNQLKDQLIKAQDRAIPNRAAYPDDDGFVEMASQHDTYGKLAGELGITRETLASYLKRRPQLAESVKAALDANKTRVGKKASQLKWRRKNLDKVREYNRRWGRNQDPAKRAKWNNYNRERRKQAESTYLMTEDDVEFAAIVRMDPCGYCNKFDKPTIDHVVPIESGGTSEWQNLSGACHSCNSSKNDDLLLLFMLRRALESDALEKEYSNG